MSGSFHVINLNLLKFELEKVEHYPHIIQSVFNKHGMHMVTYVHEQMSMSGSPSEPGSFPGIKTGMLYDSITYTVNGHHNLTLRADAPYAGFLEEGTSKMEARPFLKPTLDAKLPDLMKDLSTRLGRPGG